MKENRVMTNKNVLKLVKPFLTNKGGLSGNEIVLVKDGKIITEDHELAEIFEDLYLLLAI